MIQEQNTYSGIRVVFDSEIDGARSKMQIDVGFGDVVHPGPVSFRYPTLLSMPEPNISGYPPETLIAEKVHAMMRHGVNNSRMKDYFDILFLSHQFSFDGLILSEAIAKAFSNRVMSMIDLETLIFQDQYKKDKTKQKQWMSFLGKNNLTVLSDSFEKIMDQIEVFIWPIFEAKNKGIPFKLNWNPSGPWK